VRVELVILGFFSSCSGVDTLSCFISSLESVADGGRLLLSSARLLLSSRSSFSDLLLMTSSLCKESKYWNIKSFDFIYHFDNDQIRVC